jgi:hypothetical protein
LQTNSGVEALVRRHPSSRFGHALAQQENSQKNTNAAEKHSKARAAMLQSSRHSGRPFLQGAPVIDFRIGQIFGLLMRTLPFFALRLAVYLGITVAYVIGVGVGGGLGLLFGKVGGASGVGTFWGALIGFGLVSGILFWAREYLLYMVKAGHIAVLVELLEGRDVPSGKSQIAYAREIVQQRFKESSLLFGLHALIRGTLRAFNRTTTSLASMLPIPGLEALVKIVDAVINTSLTYLDEVILGEIMRQRSTNPWATARDCVVLYAQNYKGVLKNAAFLTLIVWGLTLVIFFVVIGPVAALVAEFPKVAGVWTFVLSVVVALAIKAALVDPFAMTALLQVYMKLIAGQTPNQEWIARLDGVSSKFRELTQRAGAAAPTTAPPAPANAVSTT